MFTFPLHVPALGSSFFIILGLCVIYKNNYSLKSYKYQFKNKIRFKNKYLLILSLILITILAFVTIDNFVIRPYIAEIFSFKGKKEMILNKNYEQAMLYFEYASKLDPYNGKLLANLGATYYNLGKYNKAEKTLKKSQHYISDRNIYRNLGLCYIGKGDYEKAKEELKYAIYIDPNFTKAYLDLAYLYADIKDYNNAIAQWNELLEINPDFSEKYNVLYFIGLAYQKKQMPDKALEYFLQALQLAPEGSPIIEELEEEIYNIYKGKLDN